MFAARSVLLCALLPLFTGCQMLASPSASDTPHVSKAGMIRMQGELSGEAGKLIFQPCGEQRRYVVEDSGNTGVLQEGASLANSQNKLFADLRGNFLASKAAGSDGQLSLYQLYRVQHADPAACNDPNFKFLTLHVNGNAPKWDISVSNKGMVLERPGKPPLALPYLEEQLPEGRFSVSSEANDQRIELWVAPQRCVDSATGAVQHLTAELRINSQVMRGCGYYGGMRND